MDVVDVTQNAILDIIDECYCSSSLVKIRTAVRGRRPTSWRRQCASSSLTPSVFRHLDVICVVKEENERGYEWNRDMDTVEGKAAA